MILLRKGRGGFTVHPLVQFSAVRAMGPLPCPLRGLRFGGCNYCQQRVATSSANGKIEMIAMCQLRKKYLQRYVIVADRVGGCQHNLGVKVGLERRESPIYLGRASTVCGRREGSTKSRLYSFDLGNEDWSHSRYRSSNRTHQLQRKPSIMWPCILFSNDTCPL